MLNAPFVPALSLPFWSSPSSGYPGFPGGSDGKASACNVGDLGLIPGLGRSPGEGNDNPFQYSCLENPVDGGAWQATVHGVAKSWTPLSSFTFFLSFSYPVDKRGKQTRHHDPWCERRIPAPSLSQEGLSWRGSTGLFIGLDSYKKTFQ